MVSGHLLNCYQWSLISGNVPVSVQLLFAGKRAPAEPNYHHPGMLPQPPGLPHPPRETLEISDSFSKIVNFAVWATLWPHKGDPEDPKVAPWPPKGVQEPPGSTPEAKMKQKCKQIEWEIN